MAAKAVKREDWRPVASPLEDLEEMEDTVESEEESSPEEVLVEDPLEEEEEEEALATLQVKSPWMAPFLARALNGVQSA